MIQDYFLIALKNIKKKRLRAFLTLVGILISIATIFVLISLSLGLEVAIQEQFETLGTDKFYVQPKGQFGPPGAATAVDLTEADVDVIERVAGVKDVTAYVVGNAKIEFKKKLKFVSAIGIEPDKMSVAFGSYGVQDGRLLKEGGGKEVMIGHQFKYNDFLGQPVDVGDKVLINDVEFKVVGIVEKIGNAQDDRMVYISKDEFRDLFDIPTRVDFIVAQVENPEEISDVAKDAEKKLIKSRDLEKDSTDFTVLTPEELLGTVKSVLNIITYFLGGIAAISLLVGGINIANSMFTSVIERTREIGVMKAIGAKNSDILYIFVIEAGLLGIVGGILGVLTGMGLGKLIEYAAVNLYGTNLLRVVFPFYLIAGSLTFAFLVGAISGLWPAWRATKIRPVEALRYE
jgi:putative ABC transport system permease protein